MFSKIGVPKNFAIFTGKYPCWKRLQPDAFYVNITKFLRTVFYRTRLVAASERINEKHKRNDFLGIFIPTLYVMIFDHINKFINVFLNTVSHNKKILQKGVSPLRLFT